jgi:hypothetical protein
MYRSVIVVAAEGCRGSEDDVEDVHVEDGLL